MSKLTKAERDKLSESSFGDPKNRLFPIVDQDDVDSAAHLIGKAKNPDSVKSRIISIAKSKSLTIPKAWKSKMTFDFGIESTGRKVENGYAIYPMSYLFESGDYKDKGIDVSEEDVWLMANLFDKPVWGNIEHTDFLRGRACEVRSAHASRIDGKMVLKGEVAVPLGLDELMTDKEKKLSVEILKEDKDIVGIALCCNPRVEAAALMSHFATSKTTSHGQYALQDIHDKSARAGAICNFDYTKMTAKPEAKALQAIHDIAVTNGATCKSGSAGSYYYNEDGENEMDEKSITASIIDGLKTFFSGNTIPKVGETETPKTEDTRFSELEKRLETERNIRFTEFATREIESRINSGQKVLPAEKDDLVALLFQARKDDEDSNDKINFADGKTKSRVDIILASLDARSAKNLSSELIPQDLLRDTQVLMNSGTDDGLKKLREDTMEWAKNNPTNGSRK